MRFPLINSPFTYKQLAAALLAGFAIRLFFVTHFSSYAGDTKFYEELARNWLDHGVYGLNIHGSLVPVDMRMPGYPAFLAAIYFLFGRTDKAVMVVQIVVDLATCVVAALIAARLAPATKRTLVATIALWMAALCPFTANYSAVVLTEVLATFLTTLALYCFVSILEPASIDRPLHSMDRKTLFSVVGSWLGVGMLVGVGTLVRPELGLLLLALGIVLAARWRHAQDWPKLVLAVSWLTLGLLLALTPWSVRNARTLGRVQFLAPRYAETQGDYIPRGFFQWTQTWMVRFGDAYQASWKLGNAQILIDTLPPAAFDSPDERARVAALLFNYNHDLNMTPALDRDFGALAQVRTARRPLRTYFFVPLARASMIWLTPRIELLPYSGRVWPPGENWRVNRTDLSVTVGYGILSGIYLLLALVGVGRCRSHPGLAVLIVFVLVRTAFLTQLQTVEPRYVIVCFPTILALGALACVTGRPDSVASECTAWVKGAAEVVAFAKVSI
jgi:4-amino-4-deoxy-L-arabinose transferase-like glycosyltransferase